MKVKALKHDIRFSVSNARNLGIQIWGENNDYPQSVKEIVNASATGKPCVILTVNLSVVKVLPILQLLKWLLIVSDKQMTIFYHC